MSPFNSSTVPREGKGISYRNSPFLLNTFNLLLASFIYFATMTSSAITAPSSTSSFSGIMDFHSPSGLDDPYPYKQEHLYFVRFQWCDNIFYEIHFSLLIHLWSPAHRSVNNKNRLPARRFLKILPIQFYR